MPFVRGRITKEHTLKGLKLKLMVIIWSQNTVTSIVKETKEMVVRLDVKQNLRRNDLRLGRWESID